MSKAVKLIYYWAVWLLEHYNDSLVIMKNSPFSAKLYYVQPFTALFLIQRLMTRTTAVKHVINTRIWKVHFYIHTLLGAAQLSVVEQWLLIGSCAAYINNTVMNVLYVQNQETTSI